MKSLEGMDLYCQNLQLSFSILNIASSPVQEDGREQLPENASEMLELMLEACRKAADIVEARRYIPAVRRNALIANSHNFTLHPEGPFCSGKGEVLMNPKSKGHVRVHLQ